MTPRWQPDAGAMWDELSPPRDADPICNERGIPESECPAHCQHDPLTRPATTTEEQSDA